MTSITPFSRADLDASVSPTDEVTLSGPVPMPSSAPAPLVAPKVAVVIPDDNAVMGLIELLLERAGVPQAEIARRLGIRHQSLNQYRWLRRKRPSIQWLAKLAQACGARLVIEFPSKR